MGARGPAPKPLALKLLNGSAEHHPERVPKNPAQPVDQPPAMPPDLAPEAQAVWRETLATQAPGVILAAHGPTLRVYCETVVAYVHARHLLLDTGVLVKGRTGLAKSPLHQVVRDNADLLRLFGKELGLTPSSIGALSAAAAPKADPMADLMRPRRIVRGA